MNILVVGAYLPRLTPERVNQFIDEDVSSFLTTIRELRSQGKTQWPEGDLVARAEEIREELNEELQSVALIELKIDSADASFDILSFHEKKTTAVAWEPAYLTTDGTELTCEPENGPPPAGSFRVAFYIHDWPNDGRLVGPNGEIDLPSFCEVPERLWRLAPYALLD
jgi:hypothetical protein